MYGADSTDIKGQERIKRALAAAGLGLGSNLLSSFT